MRGGLGEVEMKNNQHSSHGLMGIRFTLEIATHGLLRQINAVETPISVLSYASLIKASQSNNPDFIQPKSAVD